MTTKTLLKTTKVVKLSSKHQITIPVSMLKSMEISGGDNLILDYVNGKIEIVNQKKLQRQKFINFKPIRLENDDIVCFSENHNDIYNQGI